MKKETITTDREGMEKCIEYARKNRDLFAVLVAEDGNILTGAVRKRRGKGFLHAERVALKRLKHNTIGATIYTTMEPCYGTPVRSKEVSCCATIVSREISKVVIGMRDPSPYINGRGVDYLRSKGIEVVLLEEEFGDDIKKLGPEYFIKVP